MVKENKLLVSDYNHTFDINKSLIHYNRNKIVKFMDEGNIFVFATAIGFNNLKRELLKYNLAYNYLSLWGGRIITNANDEIIFKKVFNQAKIDEINDVLNQFGKNVEIVYENELDFDGKVIRIMVTLKNWFIERELMDKLKKISGIKIIKSFGDINILESDVDKKDSVQFIADAEDIKRENIWTVGDSSDDLGMIKEYNGYASILGNRECKKSALGTIISVGNLASNIDKGFVRVRKL